VPHAALFGRGGLFDRFFFALEPGHRRKLSVLSYKFSVKERVALGAGPLASNLQFLTSDF
jgi:hypothetical protein